MKKYILLLATLFASSLFFATSCGEDEIEDDNYSEYEEFMDANGNVAKVKVSVLETSTKKESIIDESSIEYDDEGNPIEDNLKYKEVDVKTTEPVSNKIVYMYYLSDWEIYNNTISKDSAYMKVSTTNEGIAEFDFDASWFEGDVNFVFVTYDDNNIPNKQANVTIKLGKSIDCTLYTSGENAFVGNYSNMFKTYELKELQQHTTLTLPWFRDGSDAIFKVNIPDNTSSWYCELSFTSAQDESGFQLLANLANMFDKKVGLALDAVSKLTAPDGTEACNLYVFDKENYLIYQNGGDKNTILFEKNFKSGIIKEYTNIEPGEYYFVFHNPYYHKVYANLELVAVIENE